MNETLTQMGLLVCMMLVGVISARLKLTDNVFNKSNSPVVMNVLLSFTIFNATINTNANIGIAQLGRIILFQTISLIICMLMGMAVAKLMRLKGAEKGLAQFMITMPNTAFVAFPVIYSVYSSTGLFYASLTNIPFNIVAYTIGVAMVSGNIKQMRFRQILSFPLVVALFSVIVFLSGVKVPEFIKKFSFTMSQATVPMSMLIVGTSLGTVSLKNALADWRVYILSFVRLIVCPLVIWFVMRYFITDPILLGVLVILASAPGAMLLTIFAVQYDRDEGFASKCVFISTIFSAATMPLMIWLLLK
ncbi:MAG: AEC family transporter [Ruminococcaceae bacterium]|nr:AEC family transporter [Oscillospiraceae bacterium]